MMKRIITAAFALLSIGSLAQNGGGISAEMMETIRSGFENSPYDKAVRNALNAGSMGALATNASNAAMMDCSFSDEVKTKAVTDQQKSGRCWLFTGLNVLRAQAIRQHKLPDDFQFSQSFCFFYDQLEKSNLFLQAVIDTRSKPMDDREVDWLFSHPVSDGGTFTGVANLVMKYGLVPAEAMPESYSANNTSGMATQLKELLRQDGLKLRSAKAKLKPGHSMEEFLEGMKVDMLKEIYRYLCLCFGEPPASFDWKGNTCTPLQFYSEFLGNDLNNDYVMLMNDPSREYGKLYEIQYDRHLYDGQNWLYLNLPVEDIKQMAIASIKAGKAMYFSCDVGKFLDRKKGTLDLANFDYESLTGIHPTMDKKERIITHSSGSSHAMTLTAVDIKDGKPVKWLVENSWGATSGYKGKLIMTDEWFNEYMFRLVVERQFIPEEKQKLLNQKAIVLPCWDPMFAAEQ